MKIRAFRSRDEEAVVRLWEECGLTRPWNDPHADIARKLTEQPELFLVGTVGRELMATAMVGYDGHRGWVYYLAVSPRHRRRSYGRLLMREAERLLIERGCPKLSLMVRSSNAEVIEFYHKLGYTQDDVISLGRRLIHDLPPEERSKGDRTQPPSAASRSGLDSVSH
jgi:ribosomal protein S18 acetylase RimI-like enzyme